MTNCICDEALSGYSDGGVRCPVHNKLDNSVISGGQYDCPHCGMKLNLRNPSGFCDHLYYPENCEVCKQNKFSDPRKPAVKKIEEKEIIVTFVMKANVEDAGLFGMKLWEKLEEAFNCRIYNPSGRETKSYDKEE
jgi:hypothetical protein